MGVTPNRGARYAWGKKKFETLNKLLPVFRKEVSIHTASQLFIKQLLLVYPQKDYTFLFLDYSKIFFRQLNARQ